MNYLNILKNEQEVIRWTAPLNLDNQLRNILNKQTEEWVQI